jgi:hypothetical protein
MLFAILFITSSTQATIPIDDTHWPSEKDKPALQPFEAPNVSKHTIFINTFIHDDVKEPQSQIFEKFFLPLIKEIEGFTGRRVSIQFIRNLQPYTNFVYENEDHQATANKWKVLALKYRNEKNLPYNKTTKFLLVTKNQLNNQAAGIAGAGQQFGIASLIRELYVGHEIGHMLDASHENGELLYRSGWWCDSYMMPAPTYLTSACHVYTNANRQRISAFLSDAP